MTFVLNTLSKKIRREDIKHHRLDERILATLINTFSFIAEVYCTTCPEEYQNVSLGITCTRISILFRPHMHQSVTTFRLRIIFQDGQFMNKLNLIHSNYLSLLGLRKEDYRLNYRSC